MFTTKSPFSHHLKQKMANKTTCKIPTANPCQLQAHYLESFSTVMIISEALRISWFVWQIISDQFEVLQTWLCKFLPGAI